MKISKITVKWKFWQKKIAILELMRTINKISPTALHLEERGVLERCLFPTVPVTVEYANPEGARFTRYD